MLHARVIATPTYEKRIAKLLPPQERTEMVEPNVVVLITAYAKNEKGNLTDADKKEIRKIVDNLKRTN